MIVVVGKMKEALLHSRRQNVILTTLVIVAIFLFYFVGASLVNDSDNVGMVIFPPIILFIYGPLVSLIYATIQTSKSRFFPEDSGNWFYRVSKRTPIIFRAIGLLGIALTIYFIFSEGIWILLLFFWPLFYLF